MEYWQWKLVHLIAQVGVDISGEGEAGKVGSSLQVSFWN